MTEEAAWALVASARLALEDRTGRAPARRPPADAHGHVWNESPTSASLGYITKEGSMDPSAWRDLDATRGLDPLMAALRDRLPAVRSVSIWTSTGTVRLSPWIDLHDGIQRTRGALESFQFNGVARFPERQPPGDERAVWLPALTGPSTAPEARLVALFVPIRRSDGRLAGAVAVDVDPRRYVVVIPA